MGKRARKAGKCYYCGTPFFGLSRPQSRTRDHVIPKCFGFSIQNNEVAACGWCNQLKANRSMEHFRRYLMTLKPEWNGAFAAETGRRGPPLWFGPVHVEWQSCRDEFDRRATREEPNHG